MRRCAAIPSRLSSIAGCFLSRQRRHHSAACGQGLYTIIKPHPPPDAPSSSSSTSSPCVDVRAWVTGVDVEPLAEKQIFDLASLPILRHPIVVMPDVHVAVGATVGTVVPTYHAIIPATVGVDIGCGMMAVKTSLLAEDLPPNLSELRIAIEEAIPHGRTHNGDANNDAGGWCNDVPREVAAVWKAQLEPAFKAICVKRPMIERSNHVNHLGTLGTGNHFIEVCVEVPQPTATIGECKNSSPPPCSSAAAGGGERRQHVWFMLHSGSRGVGSRIGQIFIDLAKSDMGTLLGQLPNKDLAYFKEGSEHFDEYIAAVRWAQDYAKLNRDLMMAAMIRAVRESGLIKKPFTTHDVAVNCHHNYVERYDIPTPSNPDDYVWLTRKGATSAKKGELAVIPGSMGAQSFIVRGKGNVSSYNSCSHGAGRKYSRGESTRRFTLAEHEKATAGVECRKDAGVLDETPMAYKSIDSVIKAQEDLIEVVTTLKQVLCIKG